MYNITKYLYAYIVYFSFNNKKNQTIVHTGIVKKKLIKQKHLKEKELHTFKKKNRSSKGV